MDAITNLALNFTLSPDETAKRLDAVGFSDETNVLLADYILSGLMNAGLYDVTSVATRLVHNRRPLLRMIRASQAIIHYVRATLFEHTKEGDKMRSAFREFLTESLGSEFGVGNIIDGSFAWKFWCACAGETLADHLTRTVLLEAAQIDKDDILFCIDSQLHYTLKEFVLHLCHMKNKTYAIQEILHANAKASRPSTHVPRNESQADCLQNAMY